MPAVAWLAPSVSSSPVDQPSTTLESTAPDSRTVNDSAEPSVADAASTDTPVPSSSTIVPTAVAVPISTPGGRASSPARSLIVTLKVSGPSTSVSANVVTENPADSVCPARIVWVDPLDW